MPDHAVGRVGRLVQHAARKASDRQPERGRHDAVGKVLGQALDRGPGDAGLVENRRVAPDDHRDGRAPGRHAIALQSLGDVAHMREQAALSRQCGGHDAEEDEAGERARQQDLHRQGDDRGGAEEKSQRQDPGRATRRAAPAIAVEPTFEPGQQPAHPGDGMAEDAVERCRIADERFEREGEAAERDRDGQRHGRE